MSSKDEIMKAAIRVFLRNGYEKASMRDIVLESGFAKGGIYHHFKNKEAIFLAAMEGLVEELNSWYHLLFKEAKTLKDVLHTYFRILPELKMFLNGISGTENEAEFNYYILIFEGLKKIPAFKKRYYKEHEMFFREFTQMLEHSKQQGIIRQDLDAHTFAFIIHALLEGSYMYSLFDEELDLPQMADNMFNLIWNAISTERGNI